MESVGRSYHADIPHYLKNRPPDFIKNCVGKIELAMPIARQDITRVGTTFVVRNVQS